MTRWAPRRQGSAIALGLCAVVLTASIWTADQAPGLCLFHWLTTLPCPSCGMTRAFIALGHGHLKEALGLNPASPLVYTATFLSLGLALVQAAVNRPVLSITWNRLQPVVYPATLIVMATAWSVQLWHRFAS